MNRCCVMCLLFLQRGCFTPHIRRLCSGGLCTSVDDYRRFAPCRTGDIWRGLARLSRFGPRTCSDKGDGDCPQQRYSCLWRSQLVFLVDQSGLARSMTTKRTTESQHMTSRCYETSTSMISQSKTTTIGNVSPAYGPGPSVSNLYYY